MSETSPLLIVIPCLNEEQYLRNVVEALLPMPPTVPVQIIITDGGSTDGTRRVATKLMELYPQIRWLDNPKRIQSAAVNLAVEKFGVRGGLFIRVDAHAGYPAHYCELLLSEIERTGADSVVVPMRTVGRGGFQNAVAAAQNSRLGNGGSAHRNRAQQGRWVEHGHHAIMKVDAFREIGGYDETFTHNEDAELDLRLRRKGYKIWLTAATSLIYYPRSTPFSLFSQYRQYGYGRARNLLKHNDKPKVRQMLPLVVAPALLATFLFPLSAIFILPASLWAILCLVYGVVLAVRERDPVIALSGFAAIIMHCAWSVGFWQGIFTGKDKRGTA